MLWKLFKLALGNWQLIAISGAIVGAIAFYGVQVTKAYKNGYDKGYSVAIEESEKATNKAIDSLASDADKARLGRAVCIANGGLWSFSDNECTKR